MSPITTWTTRAVSLICLALALRATAAADAAAVLAAAKVTGTGGVAVHLGCGDGALAADLAGRGQFIVHGLDADAAAVDAGRRALYERGLYGQVSLEEWTAANLPYADNVVNLLVVDKAGAVAREEMLRVLCPGGVVLTKDAGGQWRREVKPRPVGMDEWTHFRHGPDRNPVSKDTGVDVPQRIQWLSTNGGEGKDVVSAGGRNFYAATTSILCRDAFNGLPLWTLRLAKGDGRCSPVATADALFTVLRGQVVAVDAATGKVRTTYAEAGESPTTILRIDDARDPGGVLVVADAAAVRAVAVTSGKVLWTYEGASPRALSVGDGAVYLVTGDPKPEPKTPSVALALELSDGKVRWSKEGLAWARSCYRSAYGNGQVVFETGRYAVPKVLIGDVDKREPAAVHFFAARDGRAIRDYSYMPAMRHDENVRAFFVDGKVAVHQMGRDKKSSAIAWFEGEGTAPTETFAPLPDGTAQTFYCYPPVATERFFIYGQMSFTDWRTRAYSSNPITRGSCGAWGEGMLPANGLTYVFPKSCSCFSMLHGFGALAPAYTRSIPGVTPASIPPGETIKARPKGGPAVGIAATRPATPATYELVQGPAYGAKAELAVRPDDWPMHRGDGYRTGSNPTTVPASLGKAWATAFVPPACPEALRAEWEEYPFVAGPLTPPIVAGGLVFVAQPHAHRVVAMDEKDGSVRWSFFANARVDTPPTVADGWCVFGARSGWVYCLRASDGVLAWRLRVAPAELRIVHCGQLESPWPAQGSVLVSGGLAYVGVGIHPLADGGVRAMAIDVATGAVKWSKTVADMGYDEKGWHMRLGLEQDYFDLFVKDGEKVAMSRWVFDPKTGDFAFKWHDAFYRAGTAADAAYVQRGTWSYGYAMNRPRMRRPLLVARGNSVLGANRVREKEAGKDAPPMGGGVLKLFRRDFKAGETFNVIWDELPNDTASRIGQYFPANRLAEDVTWSAPHPGWVEAMTLAGDHLFVYAKDALRVYAAADGKAVGEVAFDDGELAKPAKDAAKGSTAPGRPVWDGMAAAGGRLYVSTRDGRVVCLRGR